LRHACVDKCNLADQKGSQAQLGNQRISSAWEPEKTEN
jgi:hypothetical protein